jgi:hypothetical protein
MPPTSHRFDGCTRIGAPTAIGLLRLLVLATALLTSAELHAVLPDEIQVYTDDIARRGEVGLELHVNTTPSGRSTPDYPGEVTPWHGLRVTPEFSYGLTDDLEPGLYLPFVRDASGNVDFAGPRLRLKWLPVRQRDGGDGWFLGVNTELSFVAERYEQGQVVLEVRPIIGVRARGWLVSFNPVLGWDLAGPQPGGAPEFSPQLKVARTVAEGIALGAEYYAEVGKLNQWLPAPERSNTLYLALDLERRNWGLNFGVGRGLNDATDRWTVKAIFSLPIW